ncbi:hypothetical protein ACFVWN_16175 [Nocardiopsis flavescens]|uniref:hypothetical protein n=1 Tax=Nocardiopsis flavescens TaxID=758803 RepID=UPI0036DDEE73
MPQREAPPWFPEPEPRHDVSGPQASAAPPAAPWAPAPERGRPEPPAAQGWTRAPRVVGQPRPADPNVINVWGQEEPTDPDAEETDVFLVMGSDRRARAELKEEGEESPPGREAEPSVSPAAETAPEPAPEPETGPEPGDERALLYRGVSLFSPEAETEARPRPDSAPEAAPADRAHDVRGSDGGPADTEAQTGAALDPAGDTVRLDAEAAAPAGAARAAAGEAEPPAAPPVREEAVGRVDAAAAGSDGADDRGGTPGPEGARYSGLADGGVAGGPVAAPDGPADAGASGAHGADAAAGASETGAVPHAGVAGGGVSGTRVAAAGGDAPDGGADAVVVEARETGDGPAVGGVAGGLAAAAADAEPAATEPADAVAGEPADARGAGARAEGVPYADLYAPPTSEQPAAVDRRGPDAAAGDPRERAARHTGPASSGVVSERGSVTASAGAASYFGSGDAASAFLSGRAADSFAPAYAAPGGYEQRLAEVKPVPDSVWKRAVFTVTRGRVNPG